MTNQAYLAASGATDGFAAYALDATGTALWQRPLGARAHDIAAHRATGICVIVGRKPGHFGYICDLATGAMLHDIKPLSGHSFDGHAVFSADGDEILTTQSANHTHGGRVVGYRVATGEITRHFSSQGIEPHELIWVAPDILAVGNGGIVDRRSTDAIHSSLVLLDATNGNLLRQWVLDEDFETLSMRHLARLRDGRFAVAMQDQDAATDRRPLLGIAGPDHELAMLEIPPDLHRRLDGYIGSVAVDRSGRIIVASAPRGGVALFWDALTTQYIGAVELADVCGVAAGDADRSFRLTSGHGQHLQASIGGDIDSADLPIAAAHGVQWDNHLTFISEFPR